MEDYEKKYKEALSRAATELETCGTDKSLRNMIYAIFPDELKESEDEKIRNRILLSLEKDLMATKNSGCDTQDLEQCIAWLEKQGESYTKKDIDDAYLKGISDAKDELEKQGTPAKLSEEEQNSFAKGVLSNCALSFINYLDAHSYEGKMCVSNGECEDIDYAFHNAMWDRLHRYYCKYIEKQDEQKPILDFKASNFYVSKVDGKIHDITYNSTNKIEPKFKIGDVLCDKSCTTIDKNSQPNIEVRDIRNDMYICNNCSFPISQQDEYELVAKKIEDEIEIPFGAKDSELIEESYYIPKSFHAEIDDDKVVIKKGEKPATWSDEDENMLVKIIEEGYLIPSERQWLKSLKNRVQPQVKELSDEDKDMVRYIGNAITCKESAKYLEEKGIDMIKAHRWLESLEPQPKEWSDEDEEMLDSIIIDVDYIGEFPDYPTKLDCELKDESNAKIKWLKSLKDRIGG